MRGITAKRLLTFLGSEGFKELSKASLTLSALSAGADVLADANNNDVSGVMADILTFGTKFTLDKLADGSTALGARMLTLAPRSWEKPRLAEADALVGAGLVTVGIVGKGLPGRW